MKTIAPHLLIVKVSKQPDGEDYAMCRTSQCVCGWISGTIVNHQQCIEMIFHFMCVWVD